MPHLCHLYAIENVKQKLTVKLFFTVINYHRKSHCRRNPHCDDTSVFSLYLFTVVTFSCLPQLIIDWVFVRNLQHCVNLHDCGGSRELKRSTVMRKQLVHHIQGRTKDGKQERNENLNVDLFYS